MNHTLDPKCPCEYCTASRASNRLLLAILAALAGCIIAALLL